MIGQLDRLVCAALFRHAGMVNGLDRARAVADRVLEQRARAALIGELDRLVRELDIGDEAQELGAVDIWDAATTEQLWRSVENLRALRDDLQPRRPSRQIGAQANG